MQLLHADGFKVYAGYTSLASEVYTVGAGVRVSTSLSELRFSGQGSVVISTEGYTIDHTINSSSDRLIGFAYNSTRIPTSTTPLIICAVLNGTTRQLELCISKDRELVVRKNGTELSRSAANVIPAGSWVYIQFRVNLHLTAGAYAVNVIYGSSAVVLQQSGISTSDASAAMNKISLGHTTGVTVPPLTTYTGIDNYFTDYTLYDPQSAPLTTFNGDQRVTALEPSGNGALSTLVGSDGNSTANYLLLNQGSTGTTPYLAGTAGAKDSYLLPDLPSSVTGNIKGVFVSARANKTDAGARSLAFGIRQGGANYPATTIPLSTVAASGYGAMLTNPATGNAFTIAEVNTAELYVEVV